MDGKEDKREQGERTGATGKEDKREQGERTGATGKEDKREQGERTGATGPIFEEGQRELAASSDASGQEDQSEYGERTGATGQEDQSEQGDRTGATGPIIEEGQRELAASSDASGVDDKEWRILLIGTTGVGKSATGNTILGKKLFESKMLAESVTSQSEIGRTERFGKKILLVDTPGLFDTRMGNEEVIDEILKCIGITSPGLHAVVWVMRPDRFKQEDKQTLELYLEHLGKDLINFVVIVFTWKEDFDEDCSIEDYINSLKQSSMLSDLIKKCKGRYVAFGNREKEDQVKDLQVKELFSVIEKLIEENGDRYYTSDRYREAETSIKREIVMEKKRLDEEEALKIEEINAHFAARIRQEEEDIGTVAKVRINPPSELELWKETQRLEKEMASLAQVNIELHSELMLTKERVQRDAEERRIVTMNEQEIRNEMERIKRERIQDREMFERILRETRTQFHREEEEMRWYAMRGNQELERLREEYRTQIDEIRQEFSRRKESSNIREYLRDKLSKNEVMLRVSAGAGAIGTGVIALLYLAI